MGPGVAGINAMIFVQNQRLVPVFLGPKGAGRVLRHLHDPASLIVEAQDGGHHVAAGGALQCGSGLLLIGNASGRRSGAGAESRRKRLCLRVKRQGNHAAVRHGDQPRLNHARGFQLGRQGLAAAVTPAQDTQAGFLG